MFLTLDVWNRLEMNQIATENNYFWKTLAMILADKRRGSMRISQYFH